MPGGSGVAPRGRATVHGAAAASAARARRDRRPGLRGGAAAHGPDVPSRSGADREPSETSVPSRAYVTEEVIIFRRGRVVLGGDSSGGGAGRVGRVRGRGSSHRRAGADAAERGVRGRGRLRRKLG